jgi:nucleotidyltransferase substrate binding protein (TIGR01987 family)
MLDLTAIEKAHKSLSNSLGVYSDQPFINKLTPAQFHTIRAGVIQNFELTYELSWKFIKRWLENNIGITEVDGVSRRQLYRLAAQSKIIKDIELWMTFHKYRNLTSHTYDENTAKEVVGTCQAFSDACQQPIFELNSKND